MKFQKCAAAFHPFRWRTIADESQINENGRRTKLIRGIVIEKMSKSPLHCTLAKILYDLFTALVRIHGYVVRREESLTLADSEPEPDVSVVIGTRRTSTNTSADRRACR